MTIKVFEQIVEAECYAWSHPDEIIFCEENTTLYFSIINGDDRLLVFRRCSGPLCSKDYYAAHKILSKALEDSLNA